MVIRRRKQTWKQVARIGQSACDQCSFCTELCPRWLLGHPIEPHRAMRSLGFNLVGEANTIGTSFCCECNLCSLYSCPEDLDPKQVCTQNKRRLAAEKKRWENPPLRRRAGGDAPGQPQGAHGPADPEARPAAVPQRRPAEATSCWPPTRSASSSSSTSAHRASRWSRPGDRVTKGQVVGRPPVTNGKPAMGAPVHASIDGTVTAVSGGVIWIQK